VNIATALCIGLGAGWFGGAWTAYLLRGWWTDAPSLPSLRARYATLKVTDTADHKIYAIKHIRAVTRLGLKEAKEASEGTVLTLSRADADELAALLRPIGVMVVVTPRRRGVSADPKRASACQE